MILITSQKKKSSRTIFPNSATISAVDEDAQIVLTEVLDLVEMGEDLAAAASHPCWLTALPPLDIIDEDDEEEGVDMIEISADSEEEGM